MQPSVALDLVKSTFKDWNEDKASRLAAALAYYTAFSVAPLLLIAISIAGLVFGDEAAQGSIFAQLQGLLGSEAAGTVEAAVKNSRQPGASTISAIIGLVTLVWSASNVFSQLQDALNTIWEVQPKPAGIVGSLKRRLLPMSMVLGIGFLLLVSLVLSAALSALGHFFNGLLPGMTVLWEVVNFVISFAVVTGLFAAIYKLLPDVEIQWSDVWIGAAVTALLFTIGKLLIGLYLGNASIGSTYGAAGSLLVVLVWVYYSAQILFFGAEFTQVYARRFGSQIRPSEHAVPLTEEARAQTGMPRKAAVQRAATTGQSVVVASQDEAKPPTTAQGKPAATADTRVTTGNGRASSQSVAHHDDRRLGPVKELLRAGGLAMAGLVAWRTSKRAGKR
jgi:membrane protein